MSEKQTAVPVIDLAKKESGIIVHLRGINKELWRNAKFELINRRAGHEGLPTSVLKYALKVDDDIGYS